MLAVAILTIDSSEGRSLTLRERHAEAEQWGADVIKVVPPQTADPMMGTPIAGLPKKDVDVAFMWELLNRGKRCIGINIATPEGRELLCSLVREADVFVTNLLSTCSPGAMSSCSQPWATMHRGYMTSTTPERPLWL